MLVCCCGSKHSCEVGSSDDAIFFANEKERGALVDNNEKQFWAVNAHTIQTLSRGLHTPHMAAEYGIRILSPCVLLMYHQTKASVVLEKAGTLVVAIVL